MPDITASTPRTEITVAGQTFSVPQPYAEGHVLSANEASALNQTYAENLRNNQAAKVKEALEAGSFDQDVFQSRIDEYAEAYEFGVRTGGGGRSGDPVMVEAMSIAREQVRQAIVKKGHKLKDVTSANITAMAKAALDSGKYPQIMELARQRVEAQREIAGIELDSLDAPADTVSEAAPEATGRKAKAASAEA